MKYIPLEQCKNNYLYRIKARNASIGIFDASISAFIVIRHKFGGKTTYRELHYDIDEHFGTARPLEELGKAIDPRPTSEPEMIEYLSKEEEKWIRINH